jgi:hypothetical protein
MPTVVKLDPFRITRDVELRITDVFDPTDEEKKFQWKQDELDEESTVRIVGESWNQLSLALTAVVPDASLRLVLPEGADAREGTALMLSIRCPATRVREVVRAKAEASGRWTATVLLNKNAAHTTVEVRPLLVRTTRTAPTESDVSGDYAAVIGEGRAVRVLIDERVLNIGSSFKVTWEEFSESGNPWRKSHPDDIFHLDFGDDKPALVLNSRYSSLRAALHSTKSKGVDAIIRHLGNGLIAQTVWIQLLVASAAAIRSDEEGGSAEEPSIEWQSAVLRKFLPRIYPTDTLDERLRKTVEAMRDPNSALAFISMAGSAVQDQVKAFKLVEQAERAGEETSTR